MASKILHSALAFLLLVTVHPAFADERDSSKQPPNIVFILIDDLGWLDLSCYGSTFYETPHLDKLPTCCEVAGVKPDSKHPLDGESLVPLFKETGPLKRDALFWHYPHYNDLSKPHGSVRQGDWKLIEFYEDQRIDLYNLKDDIGEKINLAQSQPEKANRLQQLLVNWRRQVGAQMPVPK